MHMYSPITSPESIASEETRYEPTNAEEAEFPSTAAANVIEESAPSHHSPKPSSLMRSLLLAVAAIVLISAIAIAWHRGNRPEQRIVWPAFDNKFKHRGTNDDLYDWKQWIIEAKQSIPPYPTGRFHGKGVVLCVTLERRGFTQLYVNLRVLTQTVKCSVPIEVMYWLQDGAIATLPPSVFKLLHSTFPNVIFTDLRTKELPKGLSMKGFQIKVFSILFSQFEEVMYLDLDNIPIVDPAFAFDLKLYKKNGAVFWPDRPGSYSCRGESWTVFDLPVPEDYPIITGNITFTEGEPNPKHSIEIQAGELLIHKKKSWRGLMLSAFVNRNHFFFNKRLMWSDKMSFGFAFNATNTKYALNPRFMYTIGKAVTLPNGVPYYAFSTFGQRNPDTGELVWLHRVLVKFYDSYLFLDSDPIGRAWHHQVYLDPSLRWGGGSREHGLPTTDVLLPLPEAQKHGVWFPYHGLGNSVVKPVSAKVRALEDDCIQYLKEMVAFSFYPYNTADCQGEKVYFCIWA